MTNNMPFMRKETSSTLLVFSAAILMLLLAGLVLPLANPFLQPAQAQTTSMRLRTVGQASGFDPPTKEKVGLTFDANVTINRGRIDITSSTIHLQADPDNHGKIYNGTITGGIFYNDSATGPSFFLPAMISGLDYSVSSDCDTSSSNQISLESGQITVPFSGPVECSKGEGSTASSPMTGTRQDSDGDGIPDASDKCTHNSNHRCFKEGGTGTTTTTQQQQPSSSTTRTGNQTKG